MNKEIYDAISKRNLIEFEYDGFLRKVEPYAYGISKAGNEVLSAYQIDGQSKSRKIPDWGFFKIDKIESLKITGDCFTRDQAGYQRDDSRMNKIFIEV